MEHLVQSVLCVRDGAQPHPEKQKLKCKFYSKQSLRMTLGLDMDLDWFLSPLS